MAETAIRHPKRGQAHRPNSWRTEGRGMPWESERITGTACGFGDGGTVRAMTERIDIDRVDPADRCKRCWPVAK